MNHPNRREGRTTVTPTEDDARGFWRHFVDAYWEKESTAVERVPESLWRLDSRELFRMLTWCSEHMKDSDVRCYLARPDLTVWQLLRPHASILPTADDGCLEAYEERMRRQIASPDGYSIFVNNVIRHDAVTWRGVRDFARGLVQQLGLPPHGFNAGVALGRYDFTPFGVHVDEGRSAFVLPIVGRKRFRIWPDHYVREHGQLVNRRGDYDDAAKESVEVEAPPGGLVYWPSDAWHIAEDTGVFTAMLAIGALVAERGRPLFAALPCDVDNLQASAQHVPDAFKTAVEGVDQIKPGEVVEQAWVRCLSSLGLRHPIPVRADPLPSERLRVEARDALIWCSLPDQHFALGVNGHCLVASGDWIPTLIERLNSGAPFEVSDLDVPSAGGSTRTLLERLWECRALTPDTQPS